MSLDECWCKGNDGGGELDQHCGDTVVFVDTRLVIAEDSMEAGGMSAILLSFCTVRTGARSTSGSGTVCSANKVLLFSNIRRFIACRIQVMGGAD